MRLAPFGLAFLLLSEVGGAFSASAQTPRPGGVVIRERIELSPGRSAPAPSDSAAASAARGADDCTGPVVGEAVFRGGRARNGTPWVSGAPMSGTFTATTSCGATASGALATGFELMYVWPAHHGGADRYNYLWRDSVAIVRLPLRATEAIDHGVFDLSGQGFPLDTGGGSGIAEFGCPYVSGRNECVEQSPFAHPGGHFSVELQVTGWATTHTYAWPDTVRCGTTTPLPFTKTRADGTEGYVGPRVAFAYRLPGGASPTQGTLAYDGAQDGFFPTVPYGDARAGEVAYVAPACAAIAQPTGVTLSVDGVIGHPLTVVPPPPVAFRFVPDPDTLGSGETAWFAVVAVSAAGTETYLDPATPVTLSVSDAVLGTLVHRRRYSSSVAYGPTITVAYRSARGQDGVPAFAAMGETPERDTPVAITATGGGLSGTGTVVRLGRLRLDLLASLDALPNGGASRLYATIQGTQAAAIPQTAPLTFTLAEPSLGTLYRRSTGQRGTTLQGVPRSAAAQGDVVFERGCSGPPSPAGTARITAAVDGWAGLVDDVSISVGERFEAGPPSTSPNVLYVFVSPSPLAPGDSAVVSVVMQNTGGCNSQGLAIPDSTRMAVAAFGGGTLAYDGDRGPIFFDVPYGDLRSGAVQFVAGPNGCDETDVLVRVEGAGLTGQAILSITASPGSPPPQGREAPGTQMSPVGEQEAPGIVADIPSCPSMLGPTESKENIVDWFQNSCPALAGLSGDPLNNAVEKLYERNLALHLGGIYPSGFGWGSFNRLYGASPPSYPLSENAGVDGFGMWLPDLHMDYPDWSYTTVRDYVTVLFESKLSSRALSSPGDLAQARRHVDFLASEYQRRVADFPDHLHSFPPVLILTSQNTDPRDDCGPDEWNLAASYCPNAYGTPTRHDQLIEYAEANGVLIVHAKVARVPGVGYRNVVFRLMNEVSILDHDNPILGWLLREGTRTTVDEHGTTYETWLPLSFDCDAVTDTPRDRVPE